MLMHLANQAFCGFSRSSRCLAGVQYVRLVDLSWRLARCSRPGRMSLERGRGRRIAITFCDEPKHERCENEHCYSSLSRREAESLPHFIEFETPALFNHEWIRTPVFPCLFVGRGFGALCGCGGFRGRLFLLPRSDQNRTIVFPDIGIVEARF
jgi:hypothetical protein